MKNIKLNNGIAFPVLGLGTFLLTPEETEQSVLIAIQNGYSLIDTANAYMNEKAVGRAIRESGVKREDLIISSKLWPSVYDEADKAIDDTLSRLGIEYIDILFLHQPVGNYHYAYKAIEKATRDGKVKSIGLSNFTIEDIQEIQKIASIYPQIIQSEAHPYYQAIELKQFLEKTEMVLMAWYPLGHGDINLLNEKELIKVADKYGKSTAQIILRHHIQLGNIVIPGSKKVEHIKSNLDIFDFELTDNEMKKISELDKNKRYYQANKLVLEGNLKFSPNFDEQI